MSDNRYYVKYDSKAARPDRSSETLPDYHDRIPLATLGIEQRAYALVERGQAGLLMHCQPQQIGIRYLLVAHHAALEVPDGIRNWQIVRPESMRWMVDIERKELNGRWQRQETRRKSRIGNDSEECAFGKRTGSPAPPGISRKPSLHCVMGAMSWPRQRNQSIYIQQKGCQSNSFSNSLIRSVVTSGESGGRTTT